MFRFLCKTILHSRNGYSSVTPHNSSMAVSPSLIRYFSSDADNPHSFTVSYHTKTCGLSPESALSTCGFESSEQLDSAISCFLKFGFSRTHISELIKKFPQVLHCDPEKTISPKFEFFLSRGASTPELVTIFTVNPWILRRSLENGMVRSFDILVELLQSYDKAIEVIKQNPYVLSMSPEAGLVPNINTLRENSVPASNIAWLIQRHWKCIGTNRFRFGEVVEKLKEMGFDPLKLRFVIAIMVLTTVSKSKWDGRVGIYKRYGWSDEDVNTAFRKYPLCMAISKDKIMDVMDFYVNKLGLEPSVLLNRPLLLSFSLKKRLIPRGAVIEFLSSKGMVKLDSIITTVFSCSEKRFLEKYVQCHVEAPHLIELYYEKLNLSDTTESGIDEE